MKIGARYAGGGGCEFVVWAPQAREIAVKIDSPGVGMIPMDRDEWGYWRAQAEEILPGAQYLYRINNDEERPDPASHFQPLGVHGPSGVVAHGEFAWSDHAWTGVPQERLVIYELHTGVFTPEGTFEAIIPRLAELHALGVTAIELMPVAEFPGERNWGYDGVYPFSAHHAYGGPTGLKRLVNACHESGLAVILDVVYNHLGPEGNYLSRFGPYFTDKYRTPWGDALNFDGEWSDGVRNYFIENALHWFDVYHIDGLRLDAIHAIHDMSARPFLMELAEQTAEFSARRGRKFLLIAESDTNDPRVVRPKEMGGFGLDAQWLDDFHHSMLTLLTAERSGYYADYGQVAHFVKAVREGFVYTGEYSPHRLRRHGQSAADTPGRRYVVFSQNHDQAGNRMLGERLSMLLSFDALKLAAGATLLSPFIPLLFMGEEYAEEAPFLYFVSHGDADLIRATREGRKAEFKAFQWASEPPDPQAAETFHRSKLDWNKRIHGRGHTLREFHRELLRLRREIPALASLDKNSMEVSGREEPRLVFLRRWAAGGQIFCVMNFDTRDTTFNASPPLGRWKKLLDSASEEWEGPGPALPEFIDTDQALTINGMSLALYEALPLASPTDKSS
ncbi:MAG: malto-oligosyltrehalose trehalohydrolase [Chloracidobacterium sp.]|nr:malto-oligosyltrehalose trehalohydrolase [Chloracidobacterium sp.]